MTEYIYKINPVTLMFNVTHGNGFINNIFLAINLDSVDKVINVTIHQINSFFVSIQINQLKPSFVTLSKRFPGRTPHIIEKKYLLPLK